MNMVLWIVACFLACVGVAEVVGHWLFVRRPKDSPGSYHLITLYDDAADVSRQLERFLVRQNWHGFTGYVVVVDMGMGEEAKRKCDALMTEMYGAFTCTVNELQDTLHSLDRAAGRPTGNSGQPLEDSRAGSV